MECCGVADVIRKEELLGFQDFKALALRIAHCIAHYITRYVAHYIAHYDQSV